MTLNVQGIIITLLVAFLVGLLLGYGLLRGRLRRQRQALQAHQQRLADLEREQEARLRQTTRQLRHDYEAELARQIEHYQDQLSAKVEELQQSYETRLKVLQQGVVPPTPATAAAKIEPIDTDDEVQTAAPPSAILELKRQYETRLKEAAQKLQHAYEKQLAHHARAVKAELQADYEKRLAAKIEHYDEQFARRQAQLEKKYEHRLETLSAVHSPPATPTPPPLPFNPPAAVTAGLNTLTPSQIMGSGDETTMTLQPPGAVAVPSGVAMAPSLSQADLEARIQEATQQIREDYEQQLAAKLEAHQQQLSARMQALEAAYKQRLETLTQSSSSAAAPESSSPSPEVADKPPTEVTGDSPHQGEEDDFGPLDLSDISQLTSADSQGGNG